MKISENLPKIAVVSFFVVGVAVFAWRQLGSSNGNDPLRSLTIPDFSELATQGKAAFDRNCAQCHGINGAGSGTGPPLVHDIYNPGHHADAAFVMAARRGVQRHHWNFGNMPPQPQVSDDDLAAIVRYMRELQTANGIFYRQHQM